MGSRRRSKNVDGAKEISREVDAAISDPPTGSQPARRRRESKSHSHRRQRRLIFESLGQRRVLAVITGSVFHDVDGSMRPEASEVSLESRLAYIDSNDNSTLDSGELFSIADSEGQFRFEDIPTGIHPVRLFNGSAEQRQTFPTGASQSPLPANFDSPIGAVLAGEQLNVLTDSSLVQIETSGTRTSQFPLDFGATGLVTAISNRPLGPGSASIIAGTFTEQNEGRSGLWLVPAGSARPQLIHYDSNEYAFASPSSAVGSDGNGVVIASGNGDEAAGTVHSIRVSKSAVGVPTLDALSIQVTSTGVEVPSDTQVLASDSAVELSAQGTEPAFASRTVFAWPPTSESDNPGSQPAPALVATLWSNNQQNWIAGSESIITGATELVSFDDAAGLLAVRYAAGQIGILDVDAGFAEIQQFDIGVGPASLISGEDAIASVTADESGATLLIHDLRDGGVLASHPIDIDSVGEPVSIIPGSTFDSYYLLGSSGALSIELGQPIPHYVEIQDTEDSVAIDFGLQVDGENERPEVQDQFDAAGIEDVPLAIDASQIAALVADDNHDRLISLVVQEPSNGEVTITPDGGVNYEPNADYNGPDAFAIRFHDGQAASQPIQFSISVAAQPDLPTGIRFIGEGIPEHTEGPYDVGTVEVLDVDIEDQYDLDVFDSRFRIEDGKLVLIGGGLDFESEPEIQLSISGYDHGAGQYFSHDIVVYVEDENDPVSELIADHSSVYENIPGAFIAALSVFDQDEGQLITYSVNDPRFETVGDEIWLKEGESVDYESESVIVLIVTADDNAGSTTSSEVRVPVIDTPEAVSQITLSNETVMELEPGATVGDVRLDGVPAADSYRLTVDDPRFEIDGSELKLLDDQAVRRSAAEQIELTITAQDTSATFNAVSETFVIEVLENDTPFHNDDNPYDVDGNGTVSPRDALAIINYLNIYGPGPVGPGDPGYGYDVNGDGEVTTLDALLIINYLNHLQNGGIVGGEGPEGEDTSQENETTTNPSDAPPPSDEESSNPLTSDLAQAPNPIAQAFLPGPTSVGSIGPVNDAPSTDLSGSTDSAFDPPLALSPDQAERASDWLQGIRNEDQDPELAEVIDEMVVLLSQSR